MAREGLSEEMAFKLRPEGWNEPAMSRCGQCKGPEAGMSSAWSNNQKRPVQQLEYNEPKGGQ